MTRLLSPIVIVIVIVANLGLDPVSVHVTAFIPVQNTDAQVQTAFKRFPHRVQEPKTTELLVVVNKSTGTGSANDSSDDNDGPSQDRRSFLVSGATATALTAFLTACNLPSLLLIDRQENDLHVPVTVATTTEPTWTGGTSLSLMSLEDAYQFTVNHPNDNDIFPFAQWPDPILRRPASTISPMDTTTSTTTSSKLQAIANRLQQTADQKGAVGLAAQQCGIDVSLVYLNTSNNNHQNQRQKRDNKSNNQHGFFLLNPRIVYRSPETQMRVWTEECLVLPPSFRATVLRDAIITIEYESIFNTVDDGDNDPTTRTQQITLDGELARAAQHEMQHDEGILILDHVEMQQLPEYMRDVERTGHELRMERAFSRHVITS
ncbi:Peptide deformylase [Seminavis robusta]|uniref:Peptide deformylase n=1 Tax=Seminavis robusta TaxID=568900 RepID=A0A9N8DDD1_9STRA|nr:Peptide deformylase [Seminavis robusta]|eukprot:Sro38_g023710.1 Peptide deformylase (376) ;mRNA; r:65199-66326